jgi:UDP-N-acetyl-D-glucosamine dehydrogenase
MNRGTSTLRSAAQFQVAPDSASSRIAVVGLGYTGLPLACSFASAGADVLAVDTRPDKIEMLRAGRSYIVDVSDREVAVLADRLHPTTDPSVISTVDTVFICVSTPLSADSGPDLSQVWAVVETTGPLLRSGTTVVLQSTVPPGTTQAVATRLAELSGLVVGETLFVAFSPERIDPGNRDGWTLANTPRLAGGVTPACTDMATTVLAEVCDTVVPVSSSAVAEMAKLLENSFRLVNIGLVNEVAALCDRMSVPIRQVVDAAATKPFAFLPHHATAGVGGECIPVDPLFLVHAAGVAGVPAGVVDAATRAAARRPIEVADAAHRWASSVGAAEGGIRVLIAGVTYKPNVPDLRNTPAEAIVRRLRSLGCRVHYSDPLVPHFEVDDEPVPSVDRSDDLAAVFDVVILATAHDAFFDPPVWRNAERVLDAVGAVAAGAHVRHV